MVQKYYPEHKDKKFKDSNLFEVWLKQTAVKKIYFQDNGQDCLIWWIDNGGEVLYSQPFQASIWNGKIVDLQWLSIGREIGLINAEKMQTDLYDFIIDKIEEL